MSMTLKPQDVVVLLKLIVTSDNRPLSYGQIAADLKMSASEVHQAIKRARCAQLVLPSAEGGLSRRLVNRAGLLEFLVHGVKYAFPPVRGGETRGIPTAHAGPALSSRIVGAGLPPVWPSAEGAVRGLEFAPLYRSVPMACVEDVQLYELLTLIDAVRGGRARERNLAVEELRHRILEDAPEHGIEHARRESKDSKELR